MTELDILSMDDSGNQINERTFLLVTAKLKQTGATFSGLVQCGAWDCFDEFNRININIEVLSVVSTKLKALQNAVINNALTVNIGIGSEHKWF